MVWLVGWAARLLAAGVIIPKTNMALCQLLGGAALLLLGQSAPNRSRRIVGAGLALFVLGVGTLTLSEHLLRYDLGIDQLLAAEAPGAAATASPNRMGPLGSTSLALLGAGLLALAWGRRRFAPHFGLAVCLINLVPAVGFLYGIDEFFSMPRLTGIALPTVVALLALGGGMALAYREGGPLAFLLRDDAGSRLVRRMLPVVIIIPLVIGWLHSMVDRRGLFDGRTSDGALVLAVMLLLSAMLWRSAVRLSQSTAAEAEAHRAVAASEERLNRAQEIANVGSWEWDIATGSLLWSPQVYRQMGELPGRFTPSHDIFLYRVHPDDRAAFVMHVEGALSGASPYDLEFRVVRPDGSVRVLYSRGQVVRGADGRPERVVGVSLDITERKQAESALQQSEERFRALVTASSHVLYRMNPDWSEMLQLQSRGFLADTDRPSRTWLQEYIHPDDQPQVAAAIAEAIRTKSVFELEHRLRRADGSWGWTLSRAVPLLDRQGQIAEWFGAASDITERKQAEELSRALAEQERLRLGAAVEQASDSVIMIDLDGTIRYVNTAFETINRTPREEAVGRSYFDQHEFEALAGAVRDSVGRGQAWRSHVTRAIPGGGSVELDVTISPAKDTSGAIIGGLITEKDVTQENFLQRQVRQAQKMEALGTLAGGITHDFNNILGSIIINTELALLDLDPSSPARWPLPLVLQAANRGKELVKQIITFSRQRAWERKPLEIVPIIKEGTKFLRSTLPKEIRIHEAVDSGSGVVLADPSHIHQILVNLCQNAALAMPGGPGRIEVSLRPVEVDAALAARHPDLKPGPYVRLTVADSGCGMSQELMERIFEPFFTTRRHGEGSGLGLAVVQGIVKSYEGTIVVSSELGKGSVFDVYIPRLEGEALAAGSAAPLIPASGEERVLLVEDEEVQRTSLTRGLEHLGYKVTARADGRTALATFQKKPSAFDIVITDQIMPRLTGLELAEALAKIRPGIPIILCTGFSEKVDGGTVGQNGIREVLMKPVTLQEITRSIRAALKKEREAG